MLRQHRRDTSVLMLNLNRYRPEADYPNGELYKEYMAVLDQLLSDWRQNAYGDDVHGVVVGDQKINEFGYMVS